MTDLDMRPLADVHEEVMYSDVGKELFVWLLEEARSLYDVAGDMMDVAYGHEDYGRANVARQHAETAISAVVGGTRQASTAIVNIVRAWRSLNIHDDPVHEMRNQMLGMLNPVDALAFLGREE